MTTSRLQQTIAEYRQRLLDHERTAMASLDYAHKQTLALIEPQLDTLFRAMTAKMQSGETIPLEWLYENNRLLVLEQYIRSSIDHYGALTKMQVESLQHQGVRLGMEAGQALLQSTVPMGVNFSFGIPSQQAIANLIGATQKGSPLADLFNGFGAEAAQGAKNALISGVTLGYGPRQIAPSIQDALNTSRYRALTIARDQANRTYRSANVETFRANSDVVEKMRRTCAFSVRTCAACIALDGTLYDLDEDPGFHTCDRCVLIPVTKSWDDILSPLGIDTTGIEDTNPALDMQTGQEWFDKQDEETQRRILGNAKYDAYADGQFTLKDVVGHSHDKDWGASIYERSLKDTLEAAGKAPAAVEEVPSALFPTQAQLNDAQLASFGNTFNATYKTTIDGNDYFVKAPRDEESSAFLGNEVASYAMGKALGIEDNLIPVKQMMLEGRDALVAPWMSGNPLLDYTRTQYTKILNALSPEEFTRLRAFEYLTADTDRHLGNYFYDPATKNFKIIDLGLSFRETGMGLFRSILTQRGNLDFDSATLQDMLSRKDDVLSALKKSDLSAVMVSGVEERFAILEELVQEANPSEQALMDIIYGDLA